MDKLWKSFRHNQSFAIGSFFALAVVVWVYGCDSTVLSILNPNHKVNREQLQSEVDNLIAQAEWRFSSLDKQDKFKAALFQMSIDYASGTTVNPVALAVTLGNLLGLGAIIDNRRKDVRIKSLKTEIENGKAKSKTTSVKKTP